MLYPKHRGIRADQHSVTPPGILSGVGPFVGPNSGTRLAHLKTTAAHDELVTDARPSTVVDRAVRR
ncbi:hypothetical protein [Micromonospora sp. DT62]|uniref:hypothetical protein n=1 Tax=Micromonospora sp. DT62 TaxID=3416521 RepID=UPI003CE98D1A